MDMSSLLDKKESRQVSYNRKDLITYALGIGCTELKYLYEKDPNFCAHPLFPHVLMWDATTLGDVIEFTLPVKPEGENVFALHGEQTIEIFHPLPLHGKFNIDHEIIDIQDKGKGCIVIIDFVMSDEEKIYNKTRFGGFFVNAKSGRKNDKVYFPQLVRSRLKPDHIREFQTLVSQAQLYRLTGDYNPLHVDPVVAKKSGLDRPNLQGLSTFGFCSRALIDHYCSGDQDRLVSISVRFAGTVYPGDTIVVESWIESRDTIHFEAKTKERGNICITNGVAKVKSSKL